MNDKLAQIRLMMPYNQFALQILNNAPEALMIPNMNTRLQGFYEKCVELYASKLSNEQVAYLVKQAQDPMHLEVQTVVGTLCRDIAEAALSYLIPDSCDSVIPSFHN